MNISPIIRTCFRSSRARPLRTALMIFGIALGVAGVVAIDIARTSVSKSFELSTAALTTRATHQITGSSLSIHQSLFTKLRTGPGIGKSAPVISKIVKVTELGERSLTLLGVDPFSETHFRNFRFNPGDPKSSETVRDTLVRGTGVIMAEELAAAHGLAQGDTLTMVLGQRQVRTRIGAFISSDNSGQMLEGLLLADIGLAQELLEMGDRITRIDLILQTPDDIRSVRAILGPDQFLVKTDNQNQAIRSLSLSFETSLTAFSILVLFMGIFLIYNTVSFSVARRQRLNGTLRALGATRTEIFWSTQVEVTFYAIVGSVLGLILGILLGKGTVQAVCTTVSQMYYTLTVSQTHITAATMAKGMATGLLAALASSLAPAVNAATTLPVTLMQPSSSESLMDRYIPRLTAAGCLLLAPALWIFTNGKMGMGVVFSGVFMLFGSAALLAPVLVRGIAQRISELILNIESKISPGKNGGDARHWTMAGMAVRNLKRSLGRTSVLIASLMVVIAVYIGIDTMTRSFRASISRWVDGNIGGDIHVSSLDELHPQLDKQLLLNIQKIKNISVVSAYNIHKNYDSKSGQTHVFSYLKDVSTKKWTWLDKAAGTGKQKEIQRLMEKNWIIVSEIFARQHGLSHASITENDAQIMMETVQGPINFRVAGIFRDFFMGGGRVVVGRQTMKKYWNKDEITSMQIFLSPKAVKNKRAAIETVIHDIMAAAHTPETLRIRSGPDIKKRVLAMFDNTFLITTALQFLTILVALTGIVNSVMALILERSREIGVLRACGAEPVHIRTMVLWECGLSGFLAGLLALPLGLFLSWVLVDVINFRAFGWTYDIEVSPTTLILSVTFSTLAALAAGLFPAVQAGRVRVIDALKME